MVLAVVARVTPPEKRSMALGVATAAGSFGQFALLPAAQLFIERLDWQGALVALATIYLVRAALIAILIAFPLTPATLYFFAASMGITWLSTAPLSNGLVGQIFGLRYMATLTSIEFFCHPQIGSFLGIWLAGSLYDATGSYNIAFMIAIGLGVFAALVNLPVDERPIAERRFFFFLNKPFLWAAIGVALLAFATAAAFSAYLEPGMLIEFANFVLCS